MTTKWAKLSEDVVDGDDEEDDDGTTTPTTPTTPAATPPPPAAAKTSSLVLRLVEGTHPKVHYGHVAIVIGSLTFFLSAVGATYGVGFFTKPLMEALEISRSVVSLCWTVALLGSALCLPLVGRAVDRFGVRVVLLVVVPPYALSLVWLGTVDHPVSMAFAFFALRLLMAVAQLVAVTLVNLWWVAYRGKAMAVMNVMAALSIAFPSIQTALEAAFGWRGALFAEAVLIIVAQTLIALAVLNHPERYGRFPDGATSARPKASDAKNAVDMSTAHIQLSDLNVEEQPLTSNGDDQGEEDTPQSTPAPPLAAAAATAAAAAMEEEIHWHWKDALRTPVFWSVSLSSFFCMTVWSGFNFHYEAFFSDNGLAPDTVHFIFIPIAVSSAVGMLPAGIMFDRVKRRTRVMAFALVLLALSLVLLLVLRNQFAAVVFGIFFGVMDAFYMIGNNSLLGTIFGRANLGMITSVNSSIVTLGIGVGPSLFGIVRDSIGSFTPLIIVLAVCSTIMAVLLFLLPLPKPPTRHLEM